MPAALIPEALAGLNAGLCKLARRWRGRVMARSNPELWRRLAEFEVGPQEAAFSFVKRLARENRWSCEFARHVFDEYRRFLYLSVVVAQPLTPAEAVDQAWRLHLTYPASYAQQLCLHVLGRRLYYESPGGIGEPAARKASYRATLAAYEREFGRPPPSRDLVRSRHAVRGSRTRPRGAPADRPRRAARKARKARGAAHARRRSSRMIETLSRPPSIIAASNRARIEAPSSSPRQASSAACGTRSDRPSLQIR